MSLPQPLCICLVRPPLMALYMQNKDDIFFMSCPADLTNNSFAENFGPTEIEGGEDFAQPDFTFGFYERDVALVMELYSTESKMIFPTTCLRVFLNLKAFDVMTL
ncbi:hypothetical protein SS1G_10176 [Sclerotinia sclerotiorum 1980 UF-70]|uniref:Uncharacterized protein n=1 Tax=Sclerotinia sclerotiorum (strain ATCC 18683 / 1980 / Ss-1) TaxID=665079 RepID=A7EXW1_SCLS1|nr:hypothetical protein SS1G_10176 [Sclerotinia sclerotiorum 1980 UF-70]EDN94303.1 hypothetical protein SS1G_10176 [Sclerotinia sclerotiorum 1980 UF-70]